GGGADTIMNGVVARALGREMQHSVGPEAREDAVDGRAVGAVDLEIGVAVTVRASAGDSRLPVSVTLSTLATVQSVVGAALMKPGVPVTRMSMTVRVTCASREAKSQAPLQLTWRTTQRLADLPPVLFDARVGLHCR